ncbi:unnamed protein product [Mytilus coruscus]|uniref:Uncharacterized protein n=1 Tax=Mytilus coruscus TaxID=42192 RepID=A0A6J8AN18_MYTCO|nr:unnamed protein product [Mytilus coruscus]
MTAKQKLESKHGVRYTELLRLPYFNAISSFVVDTMHNLFQGTAKYMFKTIWKDKLTGQDLQEIQDMVDNVTIPASFGRIPRKIKSSFSSFTSEQWKNWTLYFSPIALKGHLPKKDFDCWLLFGEACRLLCVSSITIQDLRKGHDWFCNADISFNGIRHDAFMNDHYLDFLQESVRCIIDINGYETLSANILQWRFAARNSEAAKNESRFQDASWCGSEGASCKMSLNRPVSDFS